MARMTVFPPDIREFLEDDEQCRREILRLIALIREARQNIRTRTRQDWKDDDKNFLEFEIEGVRAVKKKISHELLKVFPQLFYDNSREPIEDADPVWVAVPVIGISADRYRMRLIRPMKLAVQEREYSVQKRKIEEQDEDTGSSD